MNKQSQQKKIVGWKSLGLLVGLLTIILLVAFTIVRFKSESGGTILGSGNIMVLTMVNVNLILGLIFLLLLSRNLIKIYFERRNHIFGASFRTKLIASFVGFSLVPTILMFIGTSGVLTNIIDNWFSVQMEAPLKNSLEIAQNYYAAKKSFLLSTSRFISGYIVMEKDGEVSLPKLSDELLKEVSDIYLIKRNEKSSYFFSSNMQKNINDGFSSGRVSTLVESGAGGDLISAVVPFMSDGKVLALVVSTYNVGNSLVDKMEEITRSYEEFFQLKQFKNPIKESYMISLLIITIVILFSATWFGFYLGKGITIPIQRLADATREVASENYDFTIDIKTTDEIGLLVDSFNKMTQDLKVSKSRLEEANISLKESYSELDRRRRYIETILENIATGVISIANTGIITTFNRSAEKILGRKAMQLVGSHFMQALGGDDALKGLVDIIDKKTHADHIKGKGLSSEVLDLNLDQESSRTTLRVNVSSLSGDEGLYLGSVIVFDDLSELIRAQKVAAWEEVARRIAHEIKNPLTPIQLSTQRLRKKFFNNHTDFDEIFDESTKIIINEVNTLKTLVDEFSEFARMPGARPVQSDINELIDEVTARYKNSPDSIQILKTLARGLPMLMIDREQIKRAIVNIIENAADAMHREGEIAIATFLEAEKGIVTINVSDHGRGIPPEDMDKLFMPYFSKKKSGTGLGLAIVDRIVAEHNGHIRVKSSKDSGTVFTIELPV